MFRHPSNPFGGVEHPAFALVGRLQNVPRLLTRSRAHHASVDRLTIANRSPSAVRAILDPHMEGGLAVEGVRGPATPCGATVIACFLVFRVQGRGGSTISIALDPIHLHAPIALINLMRAAVAIRTLCEAATKRRRDCINVCIHAALHPAEVDIELSASTKHVERCLGCHCTPALDCPSLVSELSIAVRNHQVRG